MTELNNSNCENSIWDDTQIVSEKKLKIKCDKNLRKNSLWQISYTRTVTKLRNSNCDKTKKLNL